MARYHVVLAPAADRQFKTLPAQAKEMVAAVLVVLSLDPRPPGCRKLQGASDLWRVRAGNYRVVYTIVDTVLTVTVVKIGDRNEIYR